MDEIFKKRESFKKGLLLALQTLAVDEHIEVCKNTRSYLSDVLCTINKKYEPKYKIRTVKTTEAGLIIKKLLVIRFK